MRRRILVIHRELAPDGGGSGVCAWILEALKDDYDVALLSFVRPDFGVVNRFYGTALDARQIDVRIALPWLPAVAREARVLRRFKLWLLFADGRRLPGFDLRIATEEESDLGGRGIQYVHFPNLSPTAGEALARRAYQAAIAWATGTSVERMRANLTVVNSDWTGRLVNERHGIETVTIHPPAAGTAPDVPWERREDCFLCVGRWDPSKRFGLIIEILRGVRARGRAVRLCIVGSGGSASYRAEVLALARTEASWVTVHEDLSRAALLDLMARSRYGIHGMEEEHYGMAIAEMVLAGAIVFVPAGGGQLEIVDDDWLRWLAPDEAVAKIVRVLDDAALQRTLRERLAARREHLGAERFSCEVRALVRGMLGT